MAGIPPDLKNRLDDTLLKSDFFTNPETLRSIFVDMRIRQWRDSLPEATSAIDRIRKTTAYLVEKTDKDGNNALILLLNVIHSGVDPDDNFHRDLTQLINDFKALDQDPLSRPYTVKTRSIRHYVFLGLLVVAIFAAVIWLNHLVSLNSQFDSVNSNASSQVMDTPATLEGPAEMTNETTSEFFKMFPMFVGSSKTYNYFKRTEQGEEIETTIDQYSERVIFIETGLGDNVRIIGLEQVGENYLTPCFDISELTGEPDLWYITDNSHIYHACSYDEAQVIARDIQEEQQGGELDTPTSLLTPDYVLPFVVGNLWKAFADNPPRDDTLYQWYVEAKVDVIVPAGEFKDCFRILLSTLPGSSIRWVCPGIGLVASEYHHRGSTDDYRMELVSYELTLSR